MTRVRHLLELLEEMPMIAAVKRKEDLEKALDSASQVIFLLYGDICTIADTVAVVKQSGKTAIIHIDLVEGLENKAIAVEYICKNTQADGIISTKPALIKAAKEAGLITIQRFFLLDSIALENIQKHIELGNADVIEILPGVMPKIIRQLCQKTSAPLIAGGLISDKEDVIAALSAGATAVSTTRSEIWDS